MLSENDEGVSSHFRNALYSWQPLGPLLKVKPLLGYM